MEAPEFQPLAEIEVDVVKPERQGFTLTGQGRDQVEYRLDVHFGMPLDARTRTVLGELLSQAELSISRRTPSALPTPPSPTSPPSPATPLRPRRDRARQR